MIRRRLRFPALLLLVAVVGAACDDGETPSDGANDAGEQPVEVTLAAIVDDIQEFWTDAASEFGFEFEALPDDAIGAMENDGADGPVCDGQNVTSEDAEGNAFAAGCDEGVIVAWDADDLFAELEEKYGIIGPAVVLAHEWGHVAQFQAGVDLPTVFAEQQADCLAGAWAGDAYDREFPPLDDDAALDDVVGAVIEFRDEPGSDAADEDAHGLGFDRISAFQEGFEQGVEKCASYIDEPPELTQVPFTDEEDAATGGNLPFEEAVPLMADSLNRVFGANFEEFPGYEPDEVADLELVELAHDEIGDAGGGAVLAMAWYATGQDTEGADALFEQACGVGAWLGGVLEDEEGELAFSSGDFDEAVMATAEVVWGASEGAEPGLVFDAVAALRAGVAEGFEACPIG